MEEYDTGPQQDRSTVFISWFDSFHRPELNDCS